LSPSWSLSGISGDGAALVVGDAGSAAGGARRMDVPGWPGGPTVIQRISPATDVLAHLETEDVAVKARKASGSVWGRGVVWILKSMVAMVRAAERRVLLHS
jgi:hypothetical protein